MSIKSLLIKRYKYIYVDFLLVFVLFFLKNGKKGHPFCSVIWQYLVRELGMSGHSLFKIEMVL
jgi:hypothetical protein